MVVLGSWKTWIAGHVDRMSISSNDSEAVLYPNQPLSEVDFELRFFGEPIVESKRHEFYESIRDEYPLLFVPPLKQGMHPSLQHYRFEKEDRSAGVSLALNSIGYFQRDYKGAPDFISEIQRITDIGNTLFSIRRFSRIGWRYINSIAYTRESGLIPLARFFNNPPSFFGIASHEFSRIDFWSATKHKGVSVSVRLQSDPGRIEGNEVLLFDIDVYRDDLKDANFTHSDVMPSVEELHNIARNFFEDSITDNYREYLKGDSLE